MESVAPRHAPGLIDRVLATNDALAAALLALRDDARAAAADATELSRWWDAAVRAHQQGDVAAADAGYARVLEAQPDHAPARRLAAVLARDRGEVELADREFSRAVALAPDDADTRIAAAQLATRLHDAERAAVLLREGLDRTP